MRAQILAALIVLVGCTSPQERTLPPPGVPATPEVGNTRNWLYGFFCGANWPPVVEGQNNELSKMGYTVIQYSQNKQEMLEQYRKITPKDDIDNLCREHDMCWIKRGDGHFECNELFLERIEKLRFDWEDDKCEQVKSAITTAFSSGQVPVKTADNMEEAEKVTKVRKIFDAPFFATMGPIQLVLDVAIGYPGPDKKCVSESD